MNRIEQLKTIIEESFKDENLFVDNICLSVPGMSGKLYRKFINNLLSKELVKNYLEVGIWKGSTAIAALYNNTQKVNYTLIDDYHGDGSGQGEKQLFLSAWNNCIGGHPNLIDQDCFSFDPVEKNIKDIDVYFYDGHHSEDSQCKALTHYYHSMADSFIYIVDDWSWKDVKNGTNRAIKDLNLNIKYFFEPGDPNLWEHGETWWNTYGIFVFEK